MNPLIYIQEHMQQFTNREQQIASYILRFPEEFVHLSALELGKKTKTSSATVIRFVKKMNYQGLSDFKVDLSRHLPDSIPVYKSIDESDNLDTIKNKLLMRASYSMERTSDILNTESIYQAVKNINHSKFVIVYGIGASDLIAQDIVQKFSRLGKNIISSTDHHQIATLIAAHKNEALFIGISSSGSNENVINLTKLAVDYHINTLVITSDASSELVRTSQLSLIHDASTEESLRYAATSSLIAQLYVVDILFYAYLLENYNQNKEKIANTKQAILDYKLLRKLN